MSIAAELVKGIEEMFAVDGKGRDVHGPTGQHANNSLREATGDIPIVPTSYLPTLVITIYKSSFLLLSRASFESC